MSGREESGAILMTALLLCLGLAVMVAGLASAATFARTGLDAEKQGRRLRAEADAGLVRAASRAEVAWAPARLESAEGLTVSLSEEPGVSGRMLRASSTVGTPGSTAWASALVERAADGLDLPWRAAAVGSLTWGLTRAEPLFASAGSAVHPPRVSVRDGRIPGVVGGTAAFEVGRPWTLDPGTLAAAEGAPPGGAVFAVPGGMSVRRLLDSIDSEVLGTGPETPVVIVGVGGAALDASGLGDLHAVLLAGGGGIELDGTTLHGAAFAEGALRLGDAGAIVFREGTLEWARHRSFARVRLVPGTREGGFTGAAG